MIQLLERTLNHNTKHERDIQYSFERSLLWRIKLHIQGTGWLQYIPPFILGSLFLVISCLASYLPTSANLDSFFTIGKLLWTVGIVDILTLKLNIRPPEQLPKRLENSIEACDSCYVILHRRSCRSFQPRKLRPQDLEEILQIAHTESKQTLGSESIRFEYVDSPLKVWPVVNVYQFLIAIGPAKYDRMAMIDVGRSLQAVVLHATKMGVGSCWIGPGADHLSVQKALKSKGRYNNKRDHIICVCAIGYKSALVPSTIRLANILSHNRKPCGELFFDHKLQRPLDITKYPFNKYAKCYEAARWSPSSYNAQPTQCLGSWDRATDTVRFDFYSSTKSRYYAPVAAGIWLRDWEAACESIGIMGRFAVLSQQERGIENADSIPALPIFIYNISWIQKDVAGFPC